MTDSSRDQPSELLLPSGVPVDPPIAGPVVAAEYEPHLSPIVDYDTPASKSWSVGTLVYSRQALILLFTLLLCGDFAYAMRERSVGPVVQLMLKRLSASDTLIAFLFTTVPTSLALFISPVVSYRSDRYRSRFGRRIPFLLVPTPIAAGAMIGIAYTEDLGRIVQNALGPHAPSFQNCALICFGVLWTLFEVAAVVAGAVLNGLINDVVPRALLGRFYGFFRQVSLGAGIIFNQWILSVADNHYKAIFIGIGLLFFVGFTIMCLTVKEGQYPPVAQAEPSSGSRMLTATRSYFKECFALTHYRWIFVAITLSAATFVPVNLFSLIYAKQINMPLARYGHLTALSYVASFVLASPLGWIVDKTHTLLASLATLATYAVMMTAAGFFIEDAKTFGIAIVAHTVLSGCFFTVSAPLQLTLFPRSTFAQYASAAGIVTSLFTIVFGVALGAFLDATHHAYRLTFVVGGCLGVGAVVTLLIVYSGFLKLGGTTGYVAPGDEIFDRDLPPPVVPH